MRIGAFDILEPAGAGGMGTVWEGRHSPTGVPVALKFLTSERARDPAHAAEFEAEARAVARLHHPRIVRIYDVGRVPDGAYPDEIQPGAPYLAMEWAPHSLDDLPQPLAWETTRGAVLEVLDALAQVHARGIVHRDIKPSNVLGRLGRLRLADFGIAHLRDAPNAAGSSSLSGTPYFMSPEQFTGAAGVIGPESDLYSVGCLAYLLATGDYPFQGKSVVELARQHMESGLPMDGVSNDFTVWLRRMTAKSPAQRYRFAAAAAADLSRIDAAFVSSGGAPTERWLSPKEVAAETLPMTTIVLTQTNIPSTSPVWQETSEAPGGTAHLPYWRGPEGLRDHVEHLRGAGMRLSAMREPPLLGRDDERDVLWGALKEVVERRRPRIAVISGEPGVGKSRLARWLGRRGHELGACRYIVSNRDGDSVLIEELRAEIGGRDPEELRERIDRLAGARVSETECRALTRLLSGELQVRSDDERRRLLLLGLRLIARDDALVVLLEDVAHDAEPVEFAHFVARRARSPLLIVVTSRKPLPDPKGLLTSVELQPLSDAQIGRVVRDVVELHPDLTARVVDRAAGNPRRAMAIVRAMVAEGRLRSGKHGFELKDDRPVSAPDDASRNLRRYRAVVDDFGRMGRDALELAAALGHDVLRQEWRAVADEAGTTIDPELEAQLETRGIIETTVDGFTFVSRAFRQTVVDESTRRNDWKSRIAVCRMTIEEPGPARAARWEFEAGAFASAVRGYLELAGEAEHRSESNRALAMLGRATEAAANLPPDQAARLTAEIDVRKAVLWGRERIEDAEAMAADVEARARAHGWDDLLAETLLARAKYARKRVELELSVELYQEAHKLFEALKDSRNAGRCLQGLGMCAVASGDLQGAEAFYDRALELFLGAQHLEGAAWCANGLGDVYRKQGELQVAESWYERGLNWFDAVGDTYGMMWCVHDLAQTRRARGNLAEAEADYERALRIARELGQRVVAPRLNLGIVRVQRGDYDGARAVFEEVVEESRARGIAGEEGIARLCLLPCEAAAGRWEDVERQLERGRDQIGTLVDQDLGRMAALASKLAAEAGLDDLARKLSDFARSQDGR